MQHRIQRPLRLRLHARPLRLTIHQEARPLLTIPLAVHLTAPLRLLTPLEAQLLLIIHRIRRRQPSQLPTVRLRHSQRHSVHPTVQPQLILQASLLRLHSTPLIALPLLSIRHIVRPQHLQRLSTLQDQHQLADLRQPRSVHHFKIMLLLAIWR